MFSAMVEKGDLARNIFYRKRKAKQSARRRACNVLVTIIVIYNIHSVSFATYQYWYKVLADAEMISEALSWKFQKLEDNLGSIFNDVFRTYR